VEWLQRVVEWAQAYPNGTLCLIYVLSVVECLVVLGLFTPGAVVLFCSGALVSLGALQLGPTMLLTCLGALTGDWLSYEIGRRYGETLFRLPLLAKRPGLIKKGADFFNRHGGKGLILAHLIGPLRPIMPAIAGTYGLPRLRFMVAISVAVVVWTTAFMLPGVAFGASLGLAAEVTKRLAILILVLALALSLGFWLTRWIVGLLSRNAEAWLNALMDWNQHHRRLGRLGAALADPRQPELPALLGLGLFLLLLGGIVVGAAWSLGGHPPVIDLNAYETIQNLREPWGVRLAALALQPGTAIAYGSFAAALGLTLAFNRNWSACLHLLAAVVFGLAVWAVLRIVPQPNLPPDAIALRVPQDLALAISVYGVAPALLVGGRLGSRFAYYGASTLILLLVLARIYLGGIWLSIALTTVALSLLWVFGLGLSYARHGRQAVALRSLWPALAVLLLVLAFSRQDYRSRVQAALPEPVLHALSGEMWWTGAWKVLPVRRVDLAGRDKQFLNLQWAGSLPAVRQALYNAGWQDLEPLTLANGLRWLASTAPIAQLPLMPRMHEGHYSVLNLRHPLDDERQYLIRLWRSGHVLDQQTPLWIGSVTIQHAGEFFRVLRYPISEISYTAALASLDPTPQGFEARDLQRATGSFTTRLLRPTP
jgi:undecaprenyl-diphosphatase